MGVIASEFNWVPAPPGVWTRIAEGPLVTGAPLQFIELAALGPATTIGLTFRGYSAAPPFYQRLGVTSTSVATWTGPSTTPISPNLIIGFLVSPWVEFWVLPTKNCMAHLHIV
jgi:hypothetical protein